MITTPSKRPAFIVPSDNHSNSYLQNRRFFIIVPGSDGLVRLKICPAAGLALIGGGYDLFRLKSNRWHILIGSIAVRIDAVKNYSVREVNKKTGGTYPAGPFSYRFTIL